MRILALFVAVLRNSLGAATINICLCGITSRCSDKPVNFTPQTPPNTQQNTLDACNGWEVDRQLEQAMDALRCPPGDALVANLSGAAVVCIGGGG